MRHAPSFAEHSHVYFCIRFSAHAKTEYENTELNARQNIGDAHIGNMPLNECLRRHFYMCEIKILPLVRVLRRMGNLLAIFCRHTHTALHWGEP